MILVQSLAIQARTQLILVAATRWNRWSFIPLTDCRLRQGPEQPERSPSRHRHGSRGPTPLGLALTLSRAADFVDTFYRCMTAIHCADVYSSQIQACCSVAPHIASEISRSWWNITFFVNLLLTQNPMIHDNKK